MSNNNKSERKAGNNKPLSISCFPSIYTHRRRSNPKTKHNTRRTFSSTSLFDIVDLSSSTKISQLSAYQKNFVGTRGSLQENKILCLPLTLGLDICFTAIYISTSTA